MVGKMTPIDSPLTAIIQENKLKDKVIENLERQLEIKDRYIEALLKFIEEIDPNYGRRIRRMIFGGGSKR